MEPQASFLLLIPLLPFAGAAFNLFVGALVKFYTGKELPKQAVVAVACGTVLVSFGFSVLALTKLLGGHAPDFIQHHVYKWIYIGDFAADMRLVVDHLSVMMILVVTGAGFLIHLYSVGYMWDDARMRRYFGYLNLFMGSMLILVLGDNIFLMVVGWEGVGLCSYLLIGFWFEEMPNAAAGMKAFVVNRIGDWAFFIGAFILFVTFAKAGHPTIAFDGLKEHAAAAHAAHPAAITLAMILLFIGATGKSAQIPLYVWLPDAMAGPTPVSALIHAATMVTAGVYMLTRLNFLLVLSPSAMAVVAVVGGLTAIFAATIGIVQNDIKKVLAYSTVSQLGYMFLGVGVAGFVAGVFHLMTHAFFKACLFLGSGSVIHGMHHEQDMRKMGGLRKYMPWTFGTMGIATLAIAGVFPFAGFFSKDEILWKTWSTAQFDGVVWPIVGEISFLGKFLWVIGFCAAGMTAFYMTRLMCMTFFGEYRGGGDHSHDDHAHGHDGDHADEHAADAHSDEAAKDAPEENASDDHGHGHDDHGHGHTPHESPWTMVLPLIILAALSMIGGWIGIPHALGVIMPGHPENYFDNWMSPVISDYAGDPHAEIVVPDGHAEDAHHGEHGGGHGDHVPPIEYVLMALSTAMALGGIGLGFYLYLIRPDIPAKIKVAAGGLYDTLLNKYYVDEIYDATVVRGLLALNGFMAWFDLKVIDGAVNGVGNFTRIFSDFTGWFDDTYVDGAVNAVGDGVTGTGRSVQAIQSGRVKQYIGFSVGGVVFLVGILAGWVYLNDILREHMSWLVGGVVGLLAVVAVWMYFGGSDDVKEARH